MEREKVLVSAEETARQKEYMDKVRALHERRTTKPLAYVLSLIHILLLQ